jgi:hypothetical protein
MCERLGKRAQQRGKSVPARRGLRRDCRGSGSRKPKQKVREKGSREYHYVIPDAVNPLEGPRRDELKSLS